MANITVDVLSDVREVDPEVFATAFSAAIHDHPRRLYVTEWPIEALRTAAVRLLANDGRTGVVVFDHGDGRREASALFNVGPAGAGVDLLRYVVERYNVNYLEAFAEKLPQLYARAGFVIVERYPFDHDLAPDGWNVDQLGTPDYCVLTLAA